MKESKDLFEISTGRHLHQLHTLHLALGVLLLPEIKTSQNDRFWAISNKAICSQGGGSAEIVETVRIDNFQSGRKNCNGFSIWNVNWLLKHFSHSLQVLEMLYCWRTLRSYQKHLICDQVWDWITPRTSAKQKAQYCCARCSRGEEPLGMKVWTMWPPQGSSFARKKTWRWLLHFVATNDPVTWGKVHWVPAAEDLSQESLRPPVKLFSTKQILPSHTKRIYRPKFQILFEYAQFTTISIRIWHSNPLGSFRNCRTVAPLEP